MKIVEMIKALPFFGNNKKRNKWRKGALSFDLFYQLAYMSTIAASGVPRDQIFERSAEIQCSSAEYFRKIKLTRDRLRYDYARACRCVGEPAKEEDIKGLLLRLSSSLTSGEPESEFLSREADARAADFENEYGRDLEALKLWTDAYISLILSAILVVVIGIVSTMIWKIETALIIAMAFIAVTTTAVGVWLIWVVSPKELTVLSKPGSKEQKIAAALLKPVLAAVIGISALFLLTGMNLGLALIIIAVIVFPLGFIMSRDDKKIAKRDNEVGPFLRSLGGVCSALETTVNAALGRF